ncbi:MAG: WD40 repeat domain-containing protein [Planctomycetia bacterium]|nr:WD40 repeat domain-containing protein [Planctomycetia bacterium]
MAAKVNEPITLTGTTGAVWSLAFSPTGDMLASCSPKDREIEAFAGTPVARLWDPKTGKNTKVLKGHQQGVYAVEFSRDGKTLVTAGADKTIRFCDVNTGEARITLQLERAATQIEFNPNSTLLASGSLRDESVLVWDVKTEKVVATLDGHTKGVWTMAFSPDGTKLAVGCGDGIIRLWDVKTGKATTLKGHTDLTHTLTFTADGKTLLSANSDNTIRRWNLATEKAEVIPLKHTAEFRSMAFSPEGSLLATGDAKSDIVLWDVATGKVIETFKGHTGWVSAITFSPDGKTLASAGEESIKLWTIKKPADK